MNNSQQPSMYIPHTVGDDYYRAARRLVRYLAAAIAAADQFTNQPIPEGIPDEEREYLERLHEMIGSFAYDLNVKRSLIESEL